MDDAWRALNFRTAGERRPLGKVMHRMALYELVLKLPAAERVVLIEYYGLEGDRLTLKEIAARHNITRERARGIKARGEWRIRRQLKFQSAISDVSEPLPGKCEDLTDKLAELSKLNKAGVPGTRLKQGG